ncbi:MAG: type II toxin-antitoxin system VapC family toxin [Trueperaceae bacterium]
MTEGLADTSLFIVRETGRPINREHAPESLAVSVITAAELRAGVLVAVDLSTRARRLATFEYVSGLDLLPVDALVAEAWAILRVALRDANRRMKANDAWIAATAMAYHIPVVTQAEDFDDVPGLEVIRV